ncbi:hypothetical protein CsSME_00016898 [Camellia sinensis var. sinensis]
MSRSVHVNLFRDDGYGSFSERKRKKAEDVESGEMNHKAAKRVFKLYLRSIIHGKSISSIDEESGSEGKEMKESKYEDTRRTYNASIELSSNSFQLEKIKAEFKNSRALQSLFLDLHFISQNKTKSPISTTTLLREKNMTELNRASKNQGFYEIVIEDEILEVLKKSIILQIREILP